MLNRVRGRASAVIKTYFSGHKILIFRVQTRVALQPIKHSLIKVVHAIAVVVVAMLVAV